MAPFTRRCKDCVDEPSLSTGAPPLHWAVAGAGIGLITLILLFTTSHRLGISSGFEDICSLRSSGPLPATCRGALQAVHGVFRSCAASSSPAPCRSRSAAAGPRAGASGRFDVTFGWGPPGKLALMFLGGLFIGFGTRLAGGCTSGHGIFGVSNFERASLTSTIAFMAAGVATTTLVYRVLAP